MDWINLWSYIIQPIFFLILVLINIVMVTVTIRSEMRLIKQNKENILDNAKRITENYEALHKLLKEIEKKD